MTPEIAVKIAKEIWADLSDRRLGTDEIDGDHDIKVEILCSHAEIILNGIGIEVDHDELEKLVEQSLIE